MAVDRKTLLLVGGGVAVVGVVYLIAKQQPTAVSPLQTISNLAGSIFGQPGLGLNQIAAQSNALQNSQMGQSSAGYYGSGSGGDTSSFGDGSGTDDGSGF